MIIEIKIPSVGESVQEAILAQWYKKTGDFVKKDEPIFVIETDKVTLEVNSEVDGIIEILVEEGENVGIGAVVAKIDTDGLPSKKDEPSPVSRSQSPDKPATEPESAPKKPEPDENKTGELYPSVRRLVKEHNIDIKKIKPTGPGGKITKGDVLLYLESREIKKEPEPLIPTDKAIEPEIVKKPMSPMRKRIAARLLEAKHNTAMLTTFNDIDMKKVMDLRAKYKDAFIKKHDVSLGFMSFFIKASVEALKEFPQLNAFIEGDDIIYHNYYHIGIAVGSPKGLVVPVIQNADKLSFAQIEKAIIDYVKKIKDNRLALSDLEGGTFTITNGGIFGSLLSTPILNTPQSGILGMHRIEKRPVVIDDEIVIRPMMYVALSYDHRIVDGREAVTFLKRIKEYIENPERMLMEV